MASAPESLTEYRAILRGLGIENKSVTGTCAADHQPFALRVATQFGLESNPASGVGPTHGHFVLIMLCPLSSNPALEREQIGKGYADLRDLPIASDLEVDPCQRYDLGGHDGWRPI